MKQATLKKTHALSMMLIILFATMVMGLLTVGCSPGGMQSKVDSAANSKNGNSGPSGQSNSPNSSSQWQNMTNELNGKSEGTYDQIPMVRINQASQSITLALPIPLLSSLADNFRSSQYPDIIFSSETIGSSSNFLVTIPLKYLLRGTSFSNFNTLPNGSTLPFMPAGELHGFSLSLPQMPSYKVYLYFTINAVAAFIEIPKYTLPFEYHNIVLNKNKTRQVGYYKLLPEQGAYPGGVYVASRIPNDLARVLNDLVSF